TRRIRQSVDLDGVDDRSGAYIAGGVAGDAFNIITGIYNPCNIVGTFGRYGMRGINIVHGVGNALNAADAMNRAGRAIQQGDRQGAIDAIGDFYGGLRGAQGSFNQALGPCFPAGTPILTPDGGEVTTVYNIRIYEYHTYFVGSRSWGFSVWVHNPSGTGTCGPGRPWTQDRNGRYHDQQGRFTRPPGTRQDGNGRWRDDRGR